MTPEEIKFWVDNVVAEIEDNGLTIQQALKKLQIDSGVFYKNITPLQKVEINQAKTANTKYGIGSKYIK